MGISRAAVMRSAERALQLVDRGNSGASETGELLTGDAGSRRIGRRGPVSYVEHTWPT
jgi:hypothetical protein